MPAFLLSPITRWLAVGAALAVMFGAWRVEAARRDAADLRASAAELAVKGRDLAIAALERQAAEATARAARIQSVRRAVDASPVTRACADSPAIRAVLHGLRGDTIGLGGAAQPVAVPTTTPTARGAR